MSEHRVVHVSKSRLTSVQLVKNAAVYPLVNDGFPIIYMGQEHGYAGGEDPFNREAIWLSGFNTKTVSGNGKLLISSSQ